MTLAVLADYFTGVPNPQYNWWPFAVCAGGLVAFVLIISAFAEVGRTRENARLRREGTWETEPYRDRPRPGYYERPWEHSSTN